MKLNSKSILVLILLLVNSYARANEKNNISEKDESALHVMRVLTEIENVNNGLWITPQGEYWDADKSQIRQSLRMFSGGLEPGNYKNCIESFWVLNKSGEQIFNGTSANSNCDGVVCFFNWNGDQIMRAGFRQDYSFTYDAENRVEKASAVNYGKIGSKEWMKREFDILYDAQGRISKIKETKIIGKGKNSSSVKVLFAYPSFTKTYEYSQDLSGIKIHLLEYRNKKKDKEQEAVINDRTVSYRLEENKWIYEMFDNKQSKLTDHIEMKFNKKLMFLENTISFLAQGGKLINRFEYDEKDLCSKKISKEWNAQGDFKSHQETEYFYELTEGEPTNSPCSYKSDYFITKYNREGVAIEQLKLRKKRVRKDTGEWGPWEDVNYVM